MNTILSLFSLPQSEFAIRRKSRIWTWFFGMMSITLVTAIWGYGNVVIRQGEGTMSATILLWMRFGIAGILMLPMLLRIRFSPREWVISLSTGALLGFSVLAQGYAMFTISVDEMAFISALYVVLTPLFVSILQRKLPSKLVWAAVGLSLGGMSLLIGKLSINLHIGILWALVAAIGCSGQIIGTNALANKVSTLQFSSVQLVGAGITLTIAVMIQGIFRPSIYHGIFHWSISQWMAITYLVVMATVIAVFLQTWGQSRVSATEAALAFNMEPVWTAVFAWAILMQGMTPIQLVGAMLIISSLTLVSKPRT